MRLLVRADDAGLCDAVNRAIAEVVTGGIAGNVSVMAPTPAFDQAAAMLLALGADRTHVTAGLHVTLSSEWQSPRWGPILPATDVPSLLDASGCFFPSPADLRATGRFDLDEAEAEVAAQLGKARTTGLEIRYLDEHMGVGRVLPGLGERLRDLARREALVYAPDLARLPPLTSASAGPGPDTDLADRIRAAEDGTYLMVTHPGIDTPELRAIRGVGYPDVGAVAAERDGDRRALLSADVRKACQDRGVTLISYTDLDAVEVPAPPS
ncbi:ChbG/HpnK family deacetylase [Actinopolymorpha sp. B17G11]|uniref:ChbG/HpnK family deacetylase n=1 Tax=Actinopolymorpha sp. B17G11 TaxID=3160861 RepID=UPI0032E52072